VAITRSLSVFDLRGTTKSLFFSEPLDALKKNPTGFTELWGF